MRILLTGASGFIGRRLATALLGRGHQLICPLRGAGRPPPVAGAAVVDRDFSRHQDPADWTPLLGGVALVINTVGILRERGGQHFQALHRQGPAALFQACVNAGVPRVLQLSALGADAGAESRYHGSKSPNTSEGCTTTACRGRASSASSARYGTSARGCGRRRSWPGQAAAAADDALPPAYWHCLKGWIALGIPAFFAFLTVFYLMVAKPA